MSKFILLFIVSFSFDAFASIRIEQGRYDCGNGPCNPTIVQTNDGSEIYMKIANASWPRFNGRYMEYISCQSSGTFKYKKSSKEENVYRDGDFKIEIVSRTSIIDGKQLCTKY